MAVVSLPLPINALYDEPQTLEFERTTRDRHFLKPKSLQHGKQKGTEGF